MEEMIPVCRFREAEERAEADSAHPGEAARLFEDLARRAPGAELAPLALYRAGDGYLAAGETEGAVRCWRRLAADYRESGWAADAQLRVAAALQDQGRPGDAAGALERFWRLFPGDESAAGALLKGASLYEESGDLYAARSLRDLYLDNYPGDVETAEALLRDRAMAELERVSPDRPLAAIAADSASALARYRALACAHPDLADPAVEARALFLAGEADFRAFRSTPFDPKAKAGDRVLRGRKALEGVLERYGACAALGVEPWNRAAACRTGEALVLFGDRIAESPLPPGLAGADADAYRAVLNDQGDRFRQAGEQALADLLRSAGPSGEETTGEAAVGEWIARAREILWPRMARRFLHMPEMAFPLVRGVAPEGDERVASREGRIEKAPLGTTWSLRLQ
jgi:tetratricopeptide (TPR) repeat protein